MLSVHLFLLLIGVHAHGTLATDSLQFSQKFSEVSWQQFPGGRYKASNIDSFPASTGISGALFELYPGGVREIHWHDIPEWAFVLEGNCRATVVGGSGAKPSDSWTFAAGDVWYFEKNVAHTVIGLQPDGCKFVSGFNDGAFVETDAFSVSSWLSGTPSNILAQTLGLDQQAVEDNILPEQFNFITQADSHEVFDTTPATTVQFPPLIHKFPLASQGAVKSNTDAGFIRLASVAEFPISDEISGALVKLAPGALRSLHWHLNFNEWQFVINGTIQAGVFTAPGKQYFSTLAAGDIGYAPRGSGHYLYNSGSTDAFVILIFDNGVFTDLDISNLGAFPPAVLATTLNTTLEFTANINYQPLALIVLPVSQA